MSRNSVISAIKNVANTGIPKGVRVILFGSQARGDAHADSDWNVLVLLNKDHLTQDDHDLYSYPFWELGWKMDAMIHPTVYTQKDWKQKANPIFRDNVKKEGIVLC